MSDDRFFLGRDDAGHWFLVPASRRIDWQVWTNLDPEDERSWTSPSWARRLRGGPESVTFTGPSEEP